MDRSIRVAGRCAVAIAAIAAIAFMVTSCWSDERMQREACIKAGGSVVVISSGSSHCIGARTAQ